MSAFYYIILKAINEYKALLRKNLSSSQCTTKVNQLGIKRKQLKAASEKKLFELGSSIVKELEKNSSSPSKEKSANCYDGASEFLLYLRKILSDYSIENNKVINSAQKASRALVTAIQLISLPEKKLTTEVGVKINECGDLIALYGSDEQIRLFNKALLQHKSRHISFFFQIIRNFSSCLEEKSYAS